MRETLGVLLGFFLAAVLGYLISEIAQKEQEKEVLESYMDSLQEIYEVIRQRMDVTRKFRHDLLSHVQTLEYLIEKQKNPDGELRKYADQLTETYRKIQKGTFCRDEITDAFLMMEKQVCIEKEIPFQIQVSKTCMEWMMPVERIGFLHNLLDNAIEANGRIPEKERKELSFWIEEDSDSCTVKLRNALASKEVFNLSTWKTDGAEHGVGTKIIRAIVEKYHGTSKIICFINDESRWNGQMKTISSKCRNIGLIYVALAWFVGNGEFVTAGRDTYAQVAYWMQIFSSGWIIVFVATLFSKLWKKGEDLSGKALVSALLYFVIAYLIH